MRRRLVVIYLWLEASERVTCCRHLVGDPVVQNNRDKNAVLSRYAAGGLCAARAR